MLKYLFIFIWLGTPLCAHAKLYKIIDEFGSVTFTDIPPNTEAKEHQLGSITSIGNPEFNTEKLNLTIPYVNEGGAMVVRGSINGIAMRFIVDTGATLLAIPPNIAKQAGLLKNKTKNIKVQTANGEVSVPKVSIKSVLVNKAQQNNVDATVQEISTTKPNMGLLGMSFFKHYKMTIHQDKREIQLQHKSMGTQ